MPIQRDENALDITLEDKKHSELATEIQKKLYYAIAQSKRTRNTQYLVKETTVGILRLMHENEMQLVGKQLIEDHRAEDVRDIQEELNKSRGDVPF